MDTEFCRIEQTFDRIRTVKTSVRSETALVRHRETGAVCFLRRYSGDGQVYRKLLNVDSPHLPRIHQVAEQDGQTLVLEEFIAGETLTDRLQKQLLSVGAARQLVLQLCRGLQELHGRGIVHRDIKPDNVILRESGAVLLDFDAARLYEPGTAVDTQVLGTVGYAAPEQFGITQSDMRADIYALGVLLNVVLTGRHPSVEQAAPGAMRKIIRRCTMTNPDNRYRNISQLMRALRFAPAKKWCVGLPAAAALAALALVFLPGQHTHAATALPQAATPAADTLQAVPSAPEASAADSTAAEASPDTSDVITGPTLPAAETPTPPTDAVIANRGEPFPLDTEVRLRSTSYLPDTEGLPDLRFTAVTAKRSAEGLVTFTVYYTANQDFTVDVHEWLGSRILVPEGTAPADQGSYCITLPAEDLVGLRGLWLTHWAVGDGLSLRNLGSIKLGETELLWLCRDHSENLNALPVGTEVELFSPSENLNTMPAGTEVEPLYMDHYVCPNGEPSTGILFTGLSAVKDEQDTVTLTIRFLAEQNFGVAVFDPPDGDRLFVRTEVEAGQTSVSLSVEMEALSQLEQLTIKFWNTPPGAVGSDAENSAHLYLNAETMARYFAPVS